MRFPSCGPRKWVLVARFPTGAPGSAWPVSGRSSGVEHNLAKVGVEGSNPFARSSFSKKTNGFEKVAQAAFCRSEFAEPWRNHMKEARRVSG